MGAVIGELVRFPCPSLSHIPMLHHKKHEHSLTSSKDPPR
jgi:hypothetical protein